MKKVLIILLLAMAAFASSPAQAQTEKQEITAEDYANNEVTMADQMREDGKIYVVVAIIAVIFAGFIVYAINIDRKVSRLEKEIGTSHKVKQNA